jgi:hypothetical protein
MEIILFGKVSKRTKILLYCTNLKYVTPDKNKFHAKVIATRVILKYNSNAFKNKELVALLKIVKDFLLFYDILPTPNCRASSLINFKLKSFQRRKAAEILPASSCIG